VQVRVLVDYVGSRYSLPSIVGKLRRAGVTTARFMPTFLPWRTMYMNLRSHRKILVVDGRTGFTGGINIRVDNMHSLNPRYRVQDLHFRLTGPVVAQMQEAFAEDWAFTTEERLKGEAWFPEVPPAGQAIARGIGDGPDEDYDVLRRIILGALACARHRVRIVTPYFLPDTTLISALNVAAMRGVVVEIVLPAKNNLRTVGWAATAQLWQVLERGCRVWLTPPPFDHTKLMLVDDAWVLFGSANWDPRSLRLNFEFNVECYDTDLVARLNGLVDEKVGGAREITLDDVNRRPLPIKLRDGVARLFSPYL
jgi:cardiolipin synthase